MALRVVFDTNILISALLSLSGAPFRCLALARSGVVQSVTCDEILDEFADKLLTKFSFDVGKIDQILAEIRSFSEIVAVPGLLRAVADDPDDDVVIECALVGQASIIVSGDKHLRNLAQYGSVRIFSANQLLAAL